MVVRVVLGVGAEAVVEVAKDLLGQERVLRLKGVGRRVEVNLHEVGLDHSAPEIKKSTLKVCQTNMTEKGASQSPNV